jgi:hypothetical protein
MQNVKNAFKFTVSITCVLLYVILFAAICAYVHMTFGFIWVLIPLILFIFITSLIAFLIIDK